MKTRMGILMLVVLFLSVSNSFAEEIKAEQEAVTEAKNVDNKICPVDGAKIGSMGEAIKIEYEGKIYSLCCEACVKTFKEDSEKYHKIADKEVGIQDDEGKDSGEQADHKVEPSQEQEEK
jgi:YHS domain-containing protein